MQGLGKRARKLKNIRHVLEELLKNVANNNKVKVVFPRAKPRNQPLDSYYERPEEALAKALQKLYLGPWRIKITHGAPKKQTQSKPDLGHRVKAFGVGRVSGAEVSRQSGAGKGTGKPVEAAPKRQMKQAHTHSGGPGFERSTESAEKARRYFERFEELCRRKGSGVVEDGYDIVVCENRKLVATFPKVYGRKGPWYIENNGYVLYVDESGNYKIMKKSEFIRMQIAKANSIGFKPSNRMTFPSGVSDYDACQKVVNGIAEVGNKIIVCRGSFPAAYFDKNMANINSDKYPVVLRNGDYVMVIEKPGEYKIIPASEYIKQATKGGENLKALSSLGSPWTQGNAEYYASIKAKNIKLVHLDTTFDSFKDFMGRYDDSKAAQVCSKYGKNAVLILKDGWAIFCSNLSASRVRQGDSSPGDWATYLYFETNKYNNLVAKAREKADPSSEKWMYNEAKKAAEKYNLPLVDLRDEYGYHIVNGADYVAREIRNSLCSKYKNAVIVVSGGYLVCRNGKIVNGALPASLA